MSTYKIQFLNKDKKFQKDEKYFNTFEDAQKWGRENLERFHPDMINNPTI